MTLLYYISELYSTTSSAVNHSAVKKRRRKRRERERERDKKVSFLPLHLTMVLRNGGRVAMGLFVRRLLGFPADGRHCSVGVGGDGWVGETKTCTFTSVMKLFFSCKLNSLEGGGRGMLKCRHCHD